MVWGSTDTCFAYARLRRRIRRPPPPLGAAARGRRRLVTVAPDEDDEDEDDVCAAEGTAEADAEWLEENLPGVDEAGREAQELFRGGLPSLRELLDRLSGDGEAEACFNDESCYNEVVNTIQTAQTQCGTFEQRQEKLGEIEPSASAVALAATEVADKSKKGRGVFEAFWQWLRSLLQPGGLLSKLKRALCRERRLIEASSLLPEGTPDWARDPAEELINKIPDPPEWLGTLLCDGESWIEGLVEDAKEWAQGVADAVWEKVLEAGEWASERITEFQNWVQGILDAINEKLDIAKAFAKDIMDRYLIPIHGAVKTAQGFIGDAKDAVDGVQGVLSGAQEVVKVVNLAANGTAALDGALPSWLVGDANGQEGSAFGVLGELHRALSAATADPNGECSEGFGSPTEVMDELKSMWEQIKGWFEGVQASIEQAQNAAADGSAKDAVAAAMGAVKALPTDLLHALTGAVCFVRMITATLRNSIDGAMDWLYDFLAKLSVGTWAAVELPDCDVEAPSDPYHCLVTVSRATVLYSSIMFPLKHIQYWDASSPPLVDPCSDQVVLDSTVTFKFTAPGMMSVYALQSHTFLSLGLSCTNSPVPDKYLLAYQSKDKRADRASLLVIVDEDGTVNKALDVKLANGDDYTGSITGIALSRDDGVVWACGRPAEPRTPVEMGTDADPMEAEDPSGPGSGAWQLMKFKLSDIEGGGTCSQIDGQERCHVKMFGDIETEALDWMGDGTKVRRCTLAFHPGSRVRRLGDRSRPAVGGRGHRGRPRGGRHRCVR